MGASRYWELTVAAPPDVAEGLTNFAWELGALGVVEEEEPERGARLRAFFAGSVPAGTLEAKVRGYLDGLHALGFPPPGELHVRGLVDENWADAWRAHFTPVPVGRRLLIAPPWERPAASGRIVITIEPGRAFGTGHHGSTVGCLQALESIVERDDPADMIDLGTGSGILAIAAARLGTGAILAVDDDPDAVACATANAALNHVADRVRCVLADAGTLATRPAPLVVANLLSAAHRRLAGHYARALLPGGTLVLGGILDSEAAEVAPVLGDHGFAFCAAVSIAGWTTLELRAPLHDLS
jgi:ribosomal protein L11 methyltransferase